MSVQARAEGLPIDAAKRRRMSNLLNDATPRRLWLFKPRYESRADWGAVAELARRMQRQELFDAIAVNRRRRELAHAELEAANDELDTLAAFGRDNGLVAAAQIAELAGLTRQRIHQRIGGAPAPDQLEIAAVG